MSLPDIELPMSKARDKNERNTEPEKDEERCIVCFLPVKLKDDTPWVHVGRGGHMVIDPEVEDDPAADLGWWPVGPDCLRRHPQLKPYTKKEP